MKESKKKYLAVWGRRGWEVFETATNLTVFKARGVNKFLAGRTQAYEFILAIEKGLNGETD